ncbi:tetratricopeptide repeat protein [Leptothrix ochracea]|uniref:tetratricopeptide repeat protein n=1 Tax=Leptothrix ochracea TaxID=735331 RepID=UPI0034E1C761
MKHGWRSGVRSVLGGALIAAAMAGAATGAWALPKVEEVAAEVHAGHYDRAEVMMRDVLEAKPKSARAHYLYAEILAHNGRMDEARRHADQAAQLDPALSFTQPDKFKAFRARLNEPVQRPPATSPAVAVSPQPMQQPMQRMNPVDTGSAHSSGGGIPSWVWVLGLAGLGYGLWRWTRRPQAVPFQTSPAMAAGNMGSTGWPGGVAGGAAVGGYPQQHGGAMGSGSGISTGMAVAGGVVGGVALGMLAEHMMHGSSSSATSNASATDQGHAAGASSGLSGGAEPGFFSPSGPGYAEPEIDFGTGNEWGDDGGGSGGDGGGGDGW